MKIIWVLLFIPPSISLAADQSQISNAFDWDILIKSIGALVGAVVAYSQVKSTHPISRSALKADVEILKLLDTSDPSYQVIKKNVDLRIRRLYESKNIYTDWATVVFGVIWAAGFAYWTFYLVKDQFTWWSLLTGYFAFAGLAWIMLGFQGGFKQIIADSHKRRKGEPVEHKAEPYDKDTEERDSTLLNKDAR